MRAPEFVLSEQRVGVVVDFVRPGDENPVFRRTLYETLGKVFEERKVKTRLVPLTELDDLRRSHAREFDAWSIQRIGRELDAEQVIFVRVDELRMRETPTHPVLEPAAGLHVKVIGTRHPAGDARLWPSNADGQTVTCTRPTRDASEPSVLDEESMKLAKDTAQLVAMFFYEVDLDESTPRER